MTGTNSQRFPTVGTESFTRAEVVMVDTMKVLSTLFRIQSYCQRHPTISLACQVVMIEAVETSVERHPKVCLGPLRVVKAVDHCLRDPRMIGKLAGRAAKGNH